MEGLEPAFRWWSCGIGVGVPLGACDGGRDLHAGRVWAFVHVELAGLALLLAGLSSNWFLCFLILAFGPPTDSLFGSLFPPALLWALYLDRVVAHWAPPPL